MDERQKWFLLKNDDESVFGPLEFSQRVRGDAEPDLLLPRPGGQPRGGGADRGGLQQDSLKITPALFF